MIKRKLKKGTIITFCLALIFGMFPKYPSLTFAEPIDSKLETTVVQNAGFEENVIIPGWSLVTNNTLSTILISNQEAHSGTSSLHFNNASNTEQLQVKSEKVPVIAGEAYTAKAFVNVVSQSHSIGFEVHYFNDEDTKIGTATFINHPKGSLPLNEWRDISVPFSVPAGATQAELRFNSGKVAITEAYFDDVSIVNDADQTITEILNGGFEEPITIPGWNLVTTNEISTINVSQSEAFSGSNSLHFNNASSLEQLQVSSEKIAVSSGEPYLATAFVNVISQSHSVGFEVHYFNADHVKVGTPTFINHPKGSLPLNEWSEITVPFDVPADATSVELRFNSGKVAVTEAYFDDIAVTLANEEELPAEGVELEIVNPGFEDVLNADGSIPGWSLVTENALSSISASSDVAHSGVNSLHFNNVSSDEQLQIKSDMITVTPNESYIAKAFVNVVSQSHSIGFQVHYFNELGVEIGSDFKLFNAAALGKNKWTEIELPFEAPAEATQIQLRFNSGKIAITEAYIDDVKVESLKGEEPPADTYPTELVNADFEADVVNSVIPGWVSEFPGPGISISTDRARSGIQSLHLHDQSETDGVSLLSEKVAVVAGESYLSTIYANVVNQTHNVVSEVRYYDENDKKITEKRELNGNLPKNEWIDLKVFSDAPANAAYARLAFYSGGISLTEVYFDDVSFELVVDDSALERDYAKPTNLGEMVSVQLGQAGVIQENSLGENEVYYHSNGLPGTFSVLDAETGELKFSKVIQNTEALWAMTVGPDKNVYFAGTADGKLYRYVPELKEVQELGVNPSDSWVWDLEATDDGKIYGSTYPNASVFEYDIDTGKFRNYGSLSSEDYARGLAVDGDDIYVGIGTVKHIYKINRITGDTEEVILKGHTGETGTIEDFYFVNGKLLVSVSTTNMSVINPETMEVENTFQYSNKISEPDPDEPHVFYYKYIDKLYKYDTNTNQSTVIEDIPLLPDTVRVKDMEWLTLSTGEKVIALVTQYGEFMHYNPKTNQVTFTELDIASSAVAIQALKTGPDGNLYMGGYQRGMSVYNPFTNDREVNIPSFAQPEGIGFLNGKAYYGTYVGAMMYSYDPKKQPDLTTNPILEYDITDEQDRPFAITSGANKLFVGTIPDYGVLGGALAIYDADTDTWTQHRNVVENQSIIGLAYHDGKLYGGTSVWGGLGITPSATEAKIFVWDVETGQKIKEFTPDIPGIDEAPRMIGDLSIGPDGNLWGAVDGTIFAMDTTTEEIVKSKTIRPSLYNSSKWFPYRLEWAPDGMLYTTLSRSLIAIDPDTLNYKVLEESFMNSMTVGVDGSIYYALGKELYEIAIPETDATLKSLTVNGETPKEFSPGELNYTLYADRSDQIVATSNQSGAVVEVTTLNDRTEITVTGTDGISTLTYTVRWSDEEEPVDPEDPIVTKNIEAVTELEGLQVDYRTDISSLELPETAEVTLDDGSKETVPVSWDTGDPLYDGEIAGTYTFTGVLDLTALENVTNTNSLTATIKVNVDEEDIPVLTKNIEKVTGLKELKVDYRTDLSSLELPETVEITLDDGSKETVPVSWDTGNPLYDGELAGTYTFTGSLDVTALENLTNTNSLSATIKVTVAKEVIEPTNPVKPPFYVKVVTFVKKVLKWLGWFF